MTNQRMLSQLLMLTPSQLPMLTPSQLPMPLPNQPLVLHQRLLLNQLPVEVVPSGSSSVSLLSVEVLEDSSGTRNTQQEAKKVKVVMPISTPDSLMKNLPEQILLSSTDNHLLLIL